VLLWTCYWAVIFLMYAYGAHDTLEVVGSGSELLNFDSEKTVCWNSFDS
jgi:hypothetical protein